MDADYGYDYFDLQISEVYSISTLGYLGYVMLIGLGTYIVKTKSKHYLKNVTRLIIENYSLVDNSYPHVW